MTKKLYRMPANENELSENGQLEIMVSANRFDMEITWECKNPVTAYNRFRKAYLQAVEDGAIPATLAAGVAKNFGLPEKVKAVKDEFGATIAFVDASENVGDQVTVSWDRNHFFVEDNEESFYICMLIDGEEIENYADIEKTYTEETVEAVEEKEETKTMTITTKKSANGAKVYYVDGKRVSRDKAIEVAAEQREGNLFTVMAERRFEAPDGTVEIRINEAECKKLKTRIGRYMYERDIEVNGEFITKVYSDDDARAIVDRITEAYLAGYAGCKINVDGTFTVIESEANPADYAITDAAFREAVTGEVKAAYATKLATEREEIMSTPLTTLEALDAAVEAETELANVEPCMTVDEKVAAYVQQSKINSLNFVLNFCTEKSAEFAKWLDMAVAENDSHNANEYSQFISTYEAKIAEIKAALAGKTPQPQFNLPSTEIRLAHQDSLKARRRGFIMNPDRLKITFTDGEFKFQYFYRRACAYRTLARYGTADEVNQVIDMLTAAVNHGNKSFKFPTFTVDNGLTQADIAEVQKDLTTPTDKPEPATEADTDDVFDLLPTLDELNDFTETDPWLIDDDAEYTERDARFNRGERHAAKLQKELREVDPTVEVTYGIDDEDDRDFFHMRFDGIFGGRYGTVAAVKETFYRLKADIAEAKAELTEANATPKTHAAAVTADLNGFYTPLYDNPELRITPIADGKQLHPAAKWFVGYDDFSKRYGIWSEYGWHVSGFSAGRDFCGWIEPDKLDDTIRRLKAAITRGDKTFDFADKPATKLEVLKAKRDAAWENVINTQAALLKAHDAHIAAENDFDAADIAYRYAAADMACDLNAKLDLPIDTLDVTTQGGLNWIIALDKIEVTFDDDAFKFHCELSDGTDFILGIYDTPAQAEKVINLLKVALANHHTEFVFPMLYNICRKALKEVA